VHIGGMQGLDRNEKGAAKGRNIQLCGSLTRGLVQLLSCVIRQTYIWVS
jgi:hypothetical protein